MEVQVLQLWHGLQQALRQVPEPVLGQVEVSQGGDVQQAPHGEGAEGVLVQRLQTVVLQLQQLQGGEALEGLRVDGLQPVVIQVQPNQRPQTSEGVPVQLLQLVVAHLQHLEQQDCRSQSGPSGETSSDSDLQLRTCSGRDSRLMNCKLSF